MTLIKQSDTTKVILVFMADSTAPTSGKTGLTPAVRVSKNGAAFAAGGGTVAELEGGFYAYTPSSGDTGTLGPLAVRATASGAVDFVAVRQVVAFDPYSASNLGLTNLDTTVSSRSTYAGADTPGTTTLLARVGSSLTISGGKVAATVATGDGADAASLKATVGAAGAGLTALGDARLANLDTTVSSRLATSAYVPPDNSDVAALVTTVGGIATTVGATSTLLTGLVVSGDHAQLTAHALALAPTGGSAPTASTVAAAVWDLATTGHTTSGTFGSAMNAAAGAGDPWATSLPGSYGAGTAGKILGTNLDAAVSSVSTGGVSAADIAAAVAAQVTTDHGAGSYIRNSEPDNAGISAVKAKTDNLPASPAAVGSAMAVADKTGFSLSATGLDAISVADPGGVTSQTTFPKILVALYRRFFRKATVTASALVTYADDGATVRTTQALSDDGTTQTQGAAT